MQRISIITGATSGIGLEFAKLIAKENTNILLISRDEQKLLTLKQQLEIITNNNIDYIAVDLSENINEWIEVIKQKVRGKNLLYVINNAGFGDFAEFSECDIEKQNKMINLNIVALTNISKLFLELAKESKADSYLLNVASVAAYMSGPLMSVYYATKAYVLSFTRAIIFENRNNKNIHISVLCPGPTNTQFIKSSSLENSGLFYNLKTMSACDVAKLGLIGLKQDKKEIITGVFNRLSVFLSKFAPKNLSEFVVYRIMKRKK
ncbi:hypothetical protein EV697_1072 [Bisgaardia hudsonensis]|uniref:Oxidoreductase n=1 Tax=Bisgaardia hudsonensis TaxID=109472 RepID=A0A4R2MUC3_9PAST|nr:SDR family oxidoreductase [Bisgaardia hudsonensis]TCP11451.1 hypothetical protein EV697_1072 [Bisgaardia hudsonensis]